MLNLRKVIQFSVILIFSIPHVYSSQAEYQSFLFWIQDRAVCGYSQGDAKYFTIVDNKFQEGELVEEIMSIVEKGEYRCIQNQNIKQGFHNHSIEFDSDFNFEVTNALIDEIGRVYYDYYYFGELRSSHYSITRQKNNRTVFCDEGFRPNASGVCEPVLECACNEIKDEALSTCEVMSELNPLEIDYDKGVSYLYPDNNHNDAERCEINTTYVEPVNACPKADYSTQTDHPIDCATGQKKYSEIDYEGFGLNPIQVRRRYESAPVDPEVRFTSSYWIFDKPTLTHLGFVPIGNIDLGYVYRFDIGDRYSRLFILKSEVIAGIRNDIFLNNPHPDLFEVRYQTDQIEITVGGNRTYVFDEDRKISEVRSANDQLIYRYIYNSETNPQLIRIENAQQRHVDFAYNTHGNLESLTDQDGHQITYEYGVDDFNKLVKVSYPDGTPADPTDNPFKQYLYEGASQTKITGIVDQDGTRIAGISYGEDGKATVSELWNGTERVEVSYPSDNESLVKFYRDTETNAYREERYTFEKVVGQYKLTSKTIVKCDNCALTTESWTYHPGNGQKSKYVSPEGVITRWYRDLQGRLTSKVDAFGTSEEQTTTFTWNDTHNQIETITTATEVTTYTFDAEGNITQTQTTPVQ